MTIRLRHEFDDGVKSTKKFLCLAHLYSENRFSMEKFNDRHYHFSNLKKIVVTPKPCYSLSKEEVKAYKKLLNESVFSPLFKGHLTFHFNPHKDNFFKILLATSLLRFLEERPVKVKKLLSSKESINRRFIFCDSVYDNHDAMMSINMAISLFKPISSFSDEEIKILLKDYLQFINKQKVLIHEKKGASFSLLTKDYFRRIL